VNAPYAEVIGDPIAHSKSPTIHRFWLERLGVCGDYRATRVSPADLPAYIAERRSDPDWRGANVTMPLKEQCLAHADEIGPCAGAIGAANVLVRRGASLVAENTDVDGVRAALAGRVPRQAHVVIVGAGGAARAALFFLKQPNVSRVAVLARDPGRAAALRAVSPPKDGLKLQFYGFDCTAEAMSGAHIAINASPLGSRGFSQMPPAVLRELSHLAHDATVFDMVYTPAETALLSFAKGLRLTAVDGLSMLIGQAAAAFEIFFGKAAPHEENEALRAVLAS